MLSLTRISFVETGTGLLRCRPDSHTVIGVTGGRRLAKFGAASFPWVYATAKHAYYSAMLELTWGGAK